MIVLPCFRRFASPRLPVAAMQGTSGISTDSGWQQSKQFKTVSGILYHPLETYLDTMCKGLSCYIARHHTCLFYKFKCLPASLICIQTSPFCVSSRRNSFCLRHAQQGKKMDLCCIKQRMQLFTISALETIYHVHSFTQAGKMLYSASWYLRSGNRW